MALVKKVRDSLLLLLVVGGVLYYTQTQLHMQRRSIEASMTANNRERSDKDRANVDVEQIRSVVEAALTRHDDGSQSSKEILQQLKQLEQKLDTLHTMSIAQKVVDTPKEIRPCGDDGKAKKTAVKVSHLEHMPVNLSLSEDDWKALKQAQEHVFDRLKTIQEDPSPSRLLLCYLGGGCGFGCRVHRMAFCLHHALLLNRTMLLKGEELSPYSKGQLEGCHEWDCFFQPIYRVSPEKVKTFMTGEYASFDRGRSEEHVLSLNVQAYINAPSAFAFEDSDLISVAAKVYGRGQPARLWLTGQLIGWLTRPSARLSAFLEGKVKSLSFELPVDFGVHIRMTDKLASEAKLHVWREYFQHVDHRMTPPEQYWHSFRRFNANTTAFVATDEPKIFSEKGRESISEYRHNRIVWNKEGAELAQSLDTRYSQRSLDNLMCEVYIMASARYFVGTFSSQVSRLVVEIQMFQGRFDVFNYVDSLDEPWYGIL